MDPHAHIAPARSWLIACYLCVFFMVLLGGLTRLTESGLSIVEWKPVTGIFPPLSTASWQQEFSGYQASPQYQKINAGMTLGDFQNIYWLEYLHRLMGRLTGFAFLLPLLYFTVTRKAEGWLLRRMTLLTGLVGLQGFIGWYMVKSGLIDAPYVSPFRLALHLFMAFSVGGLLVATYLRLKKPAVPFTPLPAYLFPLSLVVLAAVMLQVVFGALVAGYDAGLAYNTFPLMDGEWVPEGVAQLTPWYRNMLLNTITIQFQHRVFAFVAAGLVIFQAVALHRHARGTLAARLTKASAGIVAIQITVGIATLLAVVPTGLASLHQMIAFLLISFCAGSSFLLYSRCQRENSGLTKGASVSAKGHVNASEHARVVG